MVSILHAILRPLVTELYETADPSDLLASKLRERAHSTHDAEHTNNGKPRRGIAWAHVCRDESDVAVAEIDENPRSSMEFSQSAIGPAENSLLHSPVVDELLAFVKSAIALGRTQEKDQLISQLLEIPIVQGIAQAQTQLSMIPIVGMGGMGKTTLARLVYDDGRVQEHFEIKAWVNMRGQNPKPLQNIARRLLKSATGVLCPLNSLVKLSEMVFDAFLSKRSLIVLDDVESMDTEAWLHMKDSWFSSVGFGSKVMITTRNQEVPNVFAVASESFSLGKLSDNDCWSLYSSLAFGPSEETEHARLIRAAKELAARCKGVPLSLKLLGSLTRFEKSLLLEKIYCADLMKIITIFQDDSFVLPMSVLALPQDLFKCFAYCGIFPCGYVLDKEKLIDMWIADGLVKPSVGTQKQNLEAIGEAYFHQLLCRSFFIDVNFEHGEIVQARMPSAVHGASRKIAEIVFKNKIGYVGGVDKKCEELSVALPFQEAYSPRQLQTLVSLPTENLHPLNRSPSFVEFKRLRSLDLNRSGIRKLSKHVCSLRKLRYLNLSHTLLTSLPKSFTNLTCLQTLNLSSCYYFKSLPKKLSSLSQLRHLDLFQCNSLTCIPSGVGRLVSLVTMTLYVLGKNDIKGAADLGQLHELNDLRGVLLIRNLENVKNISEARAADLQEKKLHHLGLSWSHKVDKCDTVLESLQPNPQLQVLDLTGYGGSRFPSWMPNLHNLVKLLINDCSCTKLPTLGKLPSLKELQLIELFNIESIGEEFFGYGDDHEGHAFPSLEKLKLHGMHKLNNWSNAAIAEESLNHYGSRAVFPSLKRLSIQDCPELQSLPSSLQCVTELVVWRSHSKILHVLTTGMESLSISSIVINDMDVEECFQGLSSLISVKKLILVGSRGLNDLQSTDIDKFRGLQHLRILHCLDLKSVEISRLGILQKLHVLDCQNLDYIDFSAQRLTLTELVVEDCPNFTSIRITANGSGSCRLRKLIVRNCPVFSIEPQTVRVLTELKMLYVNGSPQVEEWLRSTESHFPCVIIWSDHSVDSIKNRLNHQ